MSGIPSKRYTTGRLLIVLAVLIIAVAVGALLYYPSCDAKIESCCLTTEMAVVRVQGECEGIKIRIVDSAGVVQAEAPVHDGLNTINISLPTEGKYLVELVARGRVADKVVVATDKIPAVRSVTAIISPLNWTLNLKVTSEGENSCVVRELTGGEFYIKQVIVVLEYRNGSMVNLTYNGHWPANGVIKIDLGLSRSAYANITSVTVFVRDSLDYYYQAVAHFPG